MTQRKKHVKIYSTHNLFIYQTKHSTYAVEGAVNGKRIRQRYSTLEEAKGRCHSLEEGSSHNVVRTSLTAQQVKDAEVATHKLPEGCSLMDAVELLMQSHSSLSVSMLDAIDRHLKTKEEKSLETYRQAKRLLGGLSDHHTGTIQSLSREEAVKFMESVPSGSFNHYLRACKGLYIWAEKHQLVQSNPFAHVSPKERLHRDVGLLSCEEAKRLLGASESLYDGDMLAYTSICLFAGLRPDSEMKELLWDAVNLDDSEIRVTIGKTKTPRCVEMPSNLVKWLRKCDQSKPIWPVNYRKKWAKIKTRAGFRGGVDQDADKDLKPWVKDYTRHTAISFKVRASGNIHATATWAGNSPAMINRHYLGLVSSSEAVEYWSI
jgi:site-specific recombinase XerD